MSKKGNLTNALGGVGGRRRIQSANRTMPLEEIEDRYSEDTRQLNQEHVDELEKSIAASNLIQPLALDSKGRLLAGGHRRAALLQLRENNPERFKELFALGVPIRIFEFDSAADPNRAVEIEVRENEHRRDYTPVEVRELADRLRAAGYEDIQGRPKTGQKVLKPKLIEIVGKSKRTVERYLASDEQKVRHVGELSAEEKRATQLEKWAKDYDQAIARTLRNAAKKLRELER